MNHLRRQSLNPTRQHHKIALKDQGYAITGEAILGTGCVEAAGAPVGAGWPAHSNRVAAISVLSRLNVTLPGSSLSNYRGGNDMSQPQDRPH